MDKSLIFKSKYLLIILAIIMSFLCCIYVINISAVFAYGEGMEPSVALDKILLQEVDEATLIANNGVGEMPYIETDITANFDSQYKNLPRRYILVYQLSNVAYLQFSSTYYEDAEQKTLIEDRVSTQNLTEYRYATTLSGEIDINCYAFNEDLQLIDIISQTIKSDRDAPSGLATVNSMDSYQAGNSVFLINMNWQTFGDDFSGNGNVFYRFDYDNSAYSDILLTQVDYNNDNITVLQIADNGTLTILYFDKADNLHSQAYRFEKFDTTPPSPPQITITPNVDMSFSNGYAKEYTVTINYFSDSQSGNKDIQQYFLNDELFVYQQPFVIKIVAKHTIKAYAEDNVGNKSSVVEKSINRSTFDVDAPTVLDFVLLFDFSNEKLATISFSATDGASGVDYAKLNNTLDNFEKSSESNFVLSFDPYNIGGVVSISVYDKAGNEHREYVALNYFNNEHLAYKIKQYHLAYQSLDKALYSEDLLALIDKEYQQISTLLVASNTQPSYFDSTFDNIDKLLEGNSFHHYEILSVPIVVSTYLTFSIVESDFLDYKKGDSIKLTMASAINSGTNYVSISGLSKGFADYFALNIYYKDALVSKLENGITVTMNLPKDYYERQFVLIDMQTNKIVDTTIINNKISFVCQKSTTYALVISGDKEKALTNGAKYINLFGKKMEYSVFFGIIFGTVGGAVVVILLITISTKIKQKRRDY